MDFDGILCMQYFYFDQHMKFSPNCSTELWPVIDVDSSFVLNIFRNNKCILMKYCLSIDIYDPSCDQYKLFFRTFQKSYDSWLIFELCLRSISWDIIGEFDQIWYIH